MVLDAMLSGHLVYLLSPALLLEYRDVLLRPKISRLHGLGEIEIDQLLTETTVNAVWREPTTHQTPSAPDPRDAHLWDLLGTEPAAVLITGDRMLIESPKPQSSIVSPATWVECFHAGTPQPETRGERRAG
ncbi:MAG: PIN domain-containing protein, partial [Desulfobacterales bacterium]